MRFGFSFTISFTTVSVKRDNTYLSLEISAIPIPRYRERNTYYFLTTSLAQRYALIRLEGRGFDSRHWLLQNFKISNLSPVWWEALSVACYHEH